MAQTAPESAHSEVMRQLFAPGAICVCGHAKHHHFGDGPCIAAHMLKSGKYADATVCPCTKWRPK